MENRERSTSHWRGGPAILPQNRWHKAFIARSLANRSSNEYRDTAETIFIATTVIEDFAMIWQATGVFRSIWLPCVDYARSMPAASPESSARVR
jgi:hypothetical protein